MKRFLLLWVLSVLFFDLRAQYFSAGEDPSSVKYDYVETPHFSVVFPRPAREYALRLAQLLEQSYRNTSLDNSVKNKKVQVLIHTKNSISNGFVSWAPKRMELMTLPPYDFEAMSWSRELAIHEFRHVSQLSTLYKGLTGLSYYVLGEQGIGLTASLVPLWFYEGDAVVSETAYSESGRGRSAEFNLEYRTRLAYGQKLSFDQYLNGSYKVPIPDHYRLGYHMVSYAKATYGKDVWNEVMDFTTNKPFLLAPFSFGIKKFTGNTREELFNKTTAYYDSIWNGSLANRQKVSDIKVDKYVNYRFPISSNGGYYAFKTSLDRNPQLVIIDSTGKEKELKTIGLINSAPSCEGNNLYWSEYMFVGRWAQVKHSVVRRYSIKDGSYSVISDHGYYSYPTFRNDSLAVVQNLPSNKIALGIYGDSFKKLVEIPLPYEQVKELRWNGSNLVYVALDKQDNMLVLNHNIKSGSVDTLLNFGRRNLSNTRLDGDKLFFISDISGKSAIYCYHLPTKSLAKAYDPKYGVSSFDIKNNELIVSSYSIKGYDIGKVPISYSDRVSVSTKPSYPVADLLSKQVGINLQDSVPSAAATYQVRKYNKFRHLFNFHSWAPFYFDPAEVQELNLKIYPGITLVSQNLLSTSFTTLGYGYTSDGHIVDVSHTFKGWMPVFNLRFDQYTTRPVLYSVSGKPYVMDSTAKRFKVALSSYLPLQFSYGAWNALVQPFVEYSRYNDIIYNSSTASYEKGLDQIVSSFYASWQMKLAHQNIFPRWGVNFYFKMASAPFESENLGNLYSYRVGLIVPGLLSNHGLSMRLCYQNQDVDRYYFSNTFSLPRGYGGSYRSNYYRAAFIDYSLPVAYPDFNLSWIAYLKRVRLNMFYDFAENNQMFFIKGTTNKVFRKTSYSSAGVDCLFDLNLLRSTFPITAGARFAYNKDKSTSFTYVFAISFY